MSQQRTYVVRAFIREKVNGGWKRPRTHLKGIVVANSRKDIEPKTKERILNIFQDPDGKVPLSNDDIRITDISICSDFFFNLTE